MAFVTSNNSFKSLIKTGRTWSIGQILDNFCFDCYIDRAAFDSEPCYRSGSSASVDVLYLNISCSATEIHCASIIRPCVFGDQLTFPTAPPRG